MTTVVSRVVWLALALSASTAACTDTDSGTNLNPAGPPMVRQVRLGETFTVNVTIDHHRVFAFGTHPEANADGEHAVTTATALDNFLRVIIDELLLGNNLEEIECRAAVDTDAFSPVPVGANPDDVKRCAAADDVLDSTCADGDGAICICQLPGGCFRASDGKTVEMGHPVGILDMNLDGGADNTRFIAGSVGIQCGAISVPIDLDNSYWNPSGDQQPPATGGFEALGPAVVLTPAGPLPTNVTCGLVFSQDVVDKDGNGVCAPPNGDVGIDCSPGDMSQFSFKVEALSMSPGSVVDSFPRTEPYFYNVTSTVKAASLAGIKITEGVANTPFTTFAITQPSDRALRFDFTAGTLKPLTKYTVTFPTTVVDLFDQPLPAAQVFSFTTAM